MFKKGIIFLVLLFGFSYQIVLSEYTVHDPAYCITNSSECDWNYNRPATEAEIKEIEAFDRTSIETSNVTSSSLIDYNKKVDEAWKWKVYINWKNMTVSEYVQKKEEILAKQKRLLEEDWEYVVNPEDEALLKLDPFQQKEIEKYVSLKKEQKKAIQQVNDWWVLQSEEVKENKAHDFVNYIPEVQTLEKQYDIISNPNASDAEKKAAYKTLEAEWIDTWEWWFSDPDPVKIKAQIEQKKEKYTQKLPTDDEIIKRAREEYWIEDGKEYSKEEYAKVNAKISKLKREKEQILIDRENAKVQLEALSEAEADIILTDTPKVQSYKKKQIDLSDLEKQKKAILAWVW